MHVQGFPLLGRPQRHGVYNANAWDSQGEKADLSDGSNQIETVPYAARATLQIEGLIDVDHHFVPNRVACLSA